MPGDYTVRFSFLLPDDVPSSINYKNSESKSKPKAKVKYYVKAILVAGDNLDTHMVHKQVLIVREKPMALKTEQ